MNALISWFARNGIAANLMMLAILMWGIASLGKIVIEAHPSRPMDVITVSVVYRGATPSDVEEAVVVHIEEAVQALEGIKSLNSKSVEGTGTVEIEVAENYDARQLLEDVKSRVDTIDNFPEGIKRPVIAIKQHQWEVISVIVAGELPEHELRVIGERVRDEIAALPGVTQAELTSVRPYEVAIEVSEKTLRRYNLTLQAIADAIDRSSLNLPAGVVKADSGEILLRTKGQAYVSQDFERIVLRPREDGSQLRLGDIATIIDGFEEEPLATAYNHKRCVKVEVYRAGNQSVIDIAETVKAYIAENKNRMPPGVELTYWRDHAKSIKIRLQSLMTSAMQSMVLVIIVLSLFLRMKIALWVSLGIPISIFGALAMMPVLDISINYTSAGAFIMVLGLIVDDAIVTGESVYSRLRNHLDKDGVTSAIKGTQDVSVPVTFGMLTTVMAFYGLVMNNAGELGKHLNVVPMIVISVLLFSWVESKFILPAHLSHLRVDDSDDKHLLSRWQNCFAEGLETFIVRFYRPFLMRVLHNRYLSLSVLIAVTIVLLSLIFGGRVGFQFFPNAQSDTLRGSLTMPIGTPFDVTKQQVEKMVAAAERLQAKYIAPDTNESIVKAIFSSTGSTGGSARPQSHIAQVMVQLVPFEVRGIKISSQELVREWRRMIGPMPGAEQVSFIGEIRRGRSMPVDIELVGQDFDALIRLSERLQAYLAGYVGVYDISDTHEAGKEELQLKLKPEAELLGIKLEDLARQVQQGFLGLEAQRIQRGRDDVRVVVRYPAEERRSPADLKNMYVRTASGIEVPFGDVAQIDVRRSPAAIHRADRFRTIAVTANVNDKVVQMETVRRDLDAWLNEAIASEHGVQYRWRGQAQEQAESLANVVSGTLLALIGIYSMLAIPFRSYTQPLIVMSVIPFGLLGAVLGHLIMGINLTLNSILGMVALIGVVVNDSLVLVDFINRRVRAGSRLFDAVADAGAVRFRPILLTSLTTFAGLCPLMVANNVQAQFLVPMAVSLGFGVLFATFITLFFVPVNYLVLNDVGSFFRRFRAEQIA